MELQKVDNMITSKVEDSNKCFPRNQKQNCKTRFDKVEKVFCNNSSVFVANRIGHSSAVIRKMFWICILIFGIVGCLWQVINFLNCYFGYPVVVNLDVYKSKFADFPGVTFCNMNPIQKQFEPCVEEKLNYDECMNLTGTGESSRVFKNISAPSCSVNPEDAFPKQNARTWLNMLSLNYDTRLKYGHQLDNLLKSCSFNQINCSSNDFKTSLSYYYGNCFTYIPRSSNVDTLIPGPECGLELEIDLEMNKYATFSNAAGVRIQVHDRHIRHTVDEKGIMVSPGAKTYLAVTKTIISRLPAPYKDRCRNYGDKDSQSNCIGLCMHNITTSKCFCSLLNNIHDDVPQCDMREPSVFCCLRENFNDKNCDCSLPCDEIVYNTQVSSAVWPIKVYSDGKTFDCFGENNTNHNFDCKRLRETRLLLKVYWDTFEYAVYSQKPMFQGSEVFSQIGGQMGLWLGISIIAIFEAFENIILFLKGV